MCCQEKLYIYIIYIYIYNTYIYISDYLNKNWMKTTVATDKGNSQNEMWHWTNDEIGVPVQSWLWVRVELMAWYLSRLESLYGIQWSWVQIPLRPTFYSYFKESVSGEYHTYINFLTYSTQFPFRNKTFTWKRGYGRHWYVWKKPLLGVDVRYYVNAYNFNLYICF